MKTYFHKITAGIILVAIIAMVAFPSAALLFPKKAEAQMSCISGIITKYISKIISGITNMMKVPVAESTVQGTTANTAGSTFGSWVSDCIIKPMVKALVKQLIHQFLSSIVDWINSGFDGSGPRFVSDPASFFADIVDRGVGEMIYGSDLNWLCSPFALDIKLALGLNYWGGGFRDRITCTLSDVINNTMNAAQRTAYRNSWQSWLDLTTQPQNNPYGAYALAKSELEVRIANKQSIAKTEADWSSGFLSTKKCVRATVLAPDGYQREGDIQIDGDYSYDLATGQELTRCDKWETVTPGKMVQEGISKVVGAEVDEYVAAEDIDAIFGALTNQMIGSIFSATGIFSGTQNRNYYRDRFAQDRAAGIFGVGSGATAPTGFGSFDCSTIGNYSSNPDNINVSYISNTTPPIIRNVKDPLNGPIATPWPASGPKTPPLLTQYQVYAQLTKYCAQQGFWTAAETAADSSIPPLHSSSQNVCSSQSNIYSNDILSTNSGSFDVDLDSGGGSPDLAIDGSTMTYARILAPGWLEITLKKPETLTSIRIQTRDSGDPLNMGSVINFYATAAATTPLSISRTLTTETANYIMTLTTPTSIQKIKITQGFGRRLWVSEVALHRYINPIINWAGEGSAVIGTLFNVFNGVTATKCTDNSALPNTSVSFTVSPQPSGTPPSYTINLNDNTITFRTAGTYTLTYTVNDGVASSQFMRTIVVD